jgi:drug/metabolite transporter (DMT)-like permease
MDSSDDGGRYAPPSSAAAGMPRQHLTRIRHRVAGLPPAVRGLMWAAASGFVFAALNATLRVLSSELDPFVTQFLRYLFGLLVMVPLILRRGVRSYIPHRIGPQFTRGFVHTIGLCLWFAALSHIPLADMTAISFTGPIFIMIGAYLFFKEPMHWERWLAASIGLLGVGIVLAPKMAGTGGWYNLVMFASAPVFAASFLLTKGLTRTESAGVIVVWQAISVALFSLPLALLAWRTPTPWQWLGFVASGILGSTGHYCLTRSFRAADISATQSVKFLDLVWATITGWLLFAEVPSTWTFFGATVILGSTLWIARRESRRGLVSAQELAESAESPATS